MLDGPRTHSLHFLRNLSEVPLDQGVWQMLLVPCQTPFTQPVRHHVPTVGMMTSNAHSHPDCKLSLADDSHLPGKLHTLPPHSQ